MYITYQHNLNIKSIVTENLYFNYLKTIFLILFRTLENNANAKGTCLNKACTHYDAVVASISFGEGTNIGFRHN